MNLIAYLRVSTQAQVDDGLGLEVQAEGLMAWAASAGHVIVSWCREEGVSGDKEEIDRPALSAALAMLEAGGAEGLAVYRLDRLARRLFRQELIIHKLQQAGRSVLSVKEPDIDSDDPTRVLVRQMLGAVAEYERAIISDRLQTGRRAKASRGGYSFGAPAFGWRPVDHELSADVAEQRTIARMVTLRAAGKSMRAIAVELDRAGFAPKRGGKWHPESVRRTLKRLAA